MLHWLIVAVCAASACGCAAPQAPPPRDSSVAKAPAASPLSSVRVYEGDQPPGCPYAIVAEISEHCGMLEAGARSRLVERLRAAALRLGGHAIVDLRDEIDSSDLVLACTVIRFTRPDCLR